MLIKLVVFQSILHGFLPIDNSEFAKTIEMCIGLMMRSPVKPRVEIYCLRFDPVLSIAVLVSEMRFGCRLMNPKKIRTPI